MIKRVMISQLHTQYIPKRASSMLYYIDPKKKHYIQKRTHQYSRVKLFYLTLIGKY